MARILPDFICKPTDFHLVFNFEQTRTVTMFEEHGINGPYTVMDKPIRALELHSLIIQFLIISDTLRPRNNTVKPRKSRH